MTVERRHRIARQALPHSCWHPDLVGQLVEDLGRVEVSPQGAQVRTLSPAANEQLVGPLSRSL